MGWMRSRPDPYPLNDARLVRDAVSDALALRFDLEEWISKRLTGDEAQQRIAEIELKRQWEICSKAAMYLRVAAGENGLYVGTLDKWDRYDQPEPVAEGDDPEDTIVVPAVPGVESPGPSKTKFTDLAIAIKMKNPEWSATQVATAVGCSKSLLSRPQYLTYANSIEEAFRESRRDGVKFRGSDLDAYEE
jgi:hypothetical protein